MPLIRTVFQPGEEIEVSEHEHAVLLAQGLVHTPQPPASHGAAGDGAGAPKPAPAKPAPPGKPTGTTEPETES